jgi:hypothetical protein
MATAGPTPSGKAAVQPVDDGAERVVVERGHLAGVDRAVRQHPVPAFPHRGRAHRDGVQPRREAGLKKESPSNVGVAGVDEGIEDERRADDTRRDVERLST